MSRIPPPSNNRTRVKSTITPGAASASALRARKTSTPSGPAPVLPSPSGTPTRPTIRPLATKSSSTSLRAGVTPKLGTPLPKAGSRSPLKPGSRSPAKTPTTPTRSQSPSKEDAPSPVKLSMREQIALRRAEAQRANSSKSHDTDSPGPDAIPGMSEPVEEEDLLGRLPLREVIERSRSNGNLNMTGRDLICLPPEIWEAHFGQTPKALASVRNYHPLPKSTGLAARKREEAPVSWFEQAELEVLRASQNEIIELQEEMYMFTSLKILEVRKNKLTGLTPSIGDLVMLSTLDVSHNSLTALPPTVWSLPHLITLDISHNRFDSLPFSSPFTEENREAYIGYMGDYDRQDPLARATSPLPALQILRASNNYITTPSIDIEHFPANLKKLDLSHNPLGGGSFLGSALITALSRLRHLSELMLNHAELSDDAFRNPVSSSPPSSFFPSLTILDASETLCTLQALSTFLVPTQKELESELTNASIRPGTIRVLAGKRVMKESWEVEAERRTKNRRAAQAEAAAALIQTREEENQPRGGIVSIPSLPVKREVAKESWELEAEAGLLTAAGRRRLRAQVAAAEQAPPPARTPSPVKRAASPPAAPAASSSNVLTHSQYYDSSSQTLKLPSTQLPGRAIHGRAFSTASPGLRDVASNADFALPLVTAPLALIYVSPIAANLKTLVLSGRRAEPAFSLPSTIPPEGLLPHLEELSLDNCRLSDTLPISRGSDDRTTEPYLILISQLFPRLRTLDLSYNSLTSSFLNGPSLSALILASPVDPDNLGTAKRPGLRHLRLRGNQIDGLDGLIEVAEQFKGNRRVSEWFLEELDFRDNSINKLPPELGLLPLDVLLVDGNTFRIPQRKVWEREGTRGLLAWLRSRLE